MATSSLAKPCGACFSGAEAVSPRSSHEGLLLEPTPWPAPGSFTLLAPRSATAEKGRWYSIKHGDLRHNYLLQQMPNV